MMKVKELPKIRIDKGIWICEDSAGHYGTGNTPREAWINYKYSLLDIVCEMVYNYEKV